MYFVRSIAITAGMAAFGSTYPASAIFGLLVGSTRFISANIDHFAFARSGMRAGAPVCLQSDFDVISSMALFRRLAVPLRPPASSVHCSKYRKPKCL
jgi:hypothetical protein